MTRELLEELKGFLDEKKAEHIECFDLENSQYFVSDVLVASTLGAKHTRSLIDDVKVFLKERGEEILRCDESDEWSVIDTGDFLLHLMSESYRAKYDLDEFLLSFCPIRPGV